MNHGLSVLIVDDDPGSLRILQAILHDAGFAVRTTASPRAALRELKSHPPDLLLTDLRMPEMSGLDLLRAALRLKPDLCCLVVTAFATDEAISDIFRAGAYDLLSKPINAEETRARLAHAAEIVRLRREAQPLRAPTAPPRRGSPEGTTPSRARELSELPALPGSAAPLDMGGRDEVFRRLERLASLLRQGVITVAEFEEKKRALLARI